MKKIENLKIGKYVLKIDTYTTNVVEYCGEKIEIDLAIGTQFRSSYIIYYNPCVIIKYNNCCEIIKYFIKYEDALEYYNEINKKINFIKNRKGEWVSNDYSSLDELLEDNLRTHLNVLFPEQSHIKFVEEDKTDNTDESTFGSEDLTSDASEFFDLNKE